MKNLFRPANAVFAAILCSMTFAACGFTPLYYPPIEEKKHTELLDTATAASLVKTGTFRKNDEEITVVFTGKQKEDAQPQPDAAFDYCTVRGVVTVPGEKEDSAETKLPIVLIPFRQDGAQYFMLAVDTVYLVEHNGLNPEFVFMMRPYSYILSAEPKDGGWEIGVVQFATAGTKVKKVAEKAVLDPDGTVLNPSDEILEMLKDPKNYEIPSKWLFLPVGQPAGDAPAQPPES